jgi:hypothetical protein
MILLATFDEHEEGPGILEKGSRPSMRVERFIRPERTAADMLDLAALGARDGLYVLRPPPPWLEDDLTHANVAQVHDVRLALVDELSGFVRKIQALSLHGCTWFFHA